MNSFYNFTCFKKQVNHKICHIHERENFVEFFRKIATLSSWMSPKCDIEMSFSQNATLIALVLV